MNRLRLIGFLCGILLLTAFSCEKNEKPHACGMEDPLENIEWLKPYIGGSDIEIYIITYEGEDYIAICNPPEMADGMTIIYDCQENKVCEWGGIYPGAFPCSLPSGFTWNYFEENRILIYKN